MPPNHSPIANTRLNALDSAPSPSVAIPSAFSATPCATSLPPGIGGMFPAQRPRANDRHPQPWASGLIQFRHPRTVPCHPSHGKRTLLLSPLRPPATAGRVPPRRRLAATTLPQPQRGDLFIAMGPPQAHSAPAERPVPRADVSRSGSNRQIVRFAWRWRVAPLAKATCF